MARPIDLGQRRVALRGTPEYSTFGQQAAARAAGDIAEVAERFQRQEFKNLAARREAEGEAAGATYGLETQPADLQLPPGDSIADEAFRRSALAAAKINVGLSAREDIIRFEDEFAGDPIGFQTALKERGKAFIKALPKDLQGEASEVYGQLGGAAQARVQNRWREFQADVTRATFERGVVAIKNEAAAKAREGDWEGAAAALAKGADMFEAASPVLAGGSGVFSLTEIDEQVRKFEGETRLEYLTGVIERSPHPTEALEAIRSGKTGEPTVDAALASAPPEDRNRLLNELGKRVRAQEREEREEERWHWAQEREAERDADRAREANGALLTAAALDGLVTDKEIAEAVTARRIHAHEGRTLSNLLKREARGTDDKPSRKTEDFRTFAALSDLRREDPEAARKEALKAREAGLITTSTMKSFFRKKIGDDEGDPESVREAKEYLNKTLRSGGGPILDEDEAERVVRAEIQLEERLAADPKADPYRVAKEVAGVVKEQQAAAPAPKPRYLVGTPQKPDPVASLEAVEKAKAAGEITEEEALVDLMALERLFEAAGIVP
jgi:hypothetical protein